MRINEIRRGLSGISVEGRIVDACMHACMMGRAVKKGTRKIINTL